MKKIILTSFIIVFANVFSQITITSSNVIQGGKKAILHSDSFGFTVQTGGENKTWDFSNLVPSESDTINFYNKDWFPQFSSYFTDANLVMTNSNEFDYWTFLKKSNSKLEIIGSIQDTGMMEYEASNFNYTILNFPMTYNSNYSETITTLTDQYYVGIDPDGPGPAPTIDSVRIYNEENIKENGIGWGKLKLPTQTNLLDVIMVEKYTINKPKFQAYVNGMWITLTQQYIQFLQLDDYTDTSDTEHNFWSNNNDYGFPVVIYYFEKGETNTSDIQFLNGPLPATKTNVFEKTNALVYPNPTNNSIQFTNLPQGNNNLKIFNALGQVVYSVQMENNSVDLSFLNAGTYFISIENAGNIYNVSIVKE